MSGATIYLDDDTCTIFKDGELKGQVKYAPHERQIFRSFREAEDTLKSLAGFLSRRMLIRPKVEIVVKRKLRGGMTDMDARILSEAAAAAGFRQCIVVADG